MINTFSEWVYGQAKSRSHGSFDATEQLILAEDPHLNGIAEWKAILETRNELASLCGIGSRAFNRDATGYTVSGNKPTSPLPRLPLSDARVGKRPFVSKINTVSSDELETVFLPLIYSAEATISNMERLLYEEEYFRSGRSGSTANRVIKNPQHATPTAVRRDVLLSLRNVLATRVGIPLRAKHDYNPNGTPPWLLTIENIPVPNYLRDEREFSGFQKTA